MSQQVQAKVGVLVPLGIGALAMVGAWRMGLGSLRDPGPGVWPLVVGLLMMVLSLALLVAREDADAQEPFSRQSIVVVGGIASLVVYAYLFERVGFEIPTVLLLALWLRVFGRDSWRLTLTVCVLATAALYLLFIVGLGVSLPHIIVL